MEAKKPVSGSGSRSPRGERGLKLDRAFPDTETGESLPSRGAWIEILWLCGEDRPGRSLPSRGAWIEIGLKSQSYTGNPVAPLAGSVD